MTERFAAIDGDAHVAEPAGFWNEYIDPAYRTRAPLRLKDHEGITRVVFEDQVVPRLGGGYGMGAKEPTILRDRETGRTIPGALNPQARLQDMDLEGIEVAVLFGTEGLLIPAVRDPGLAVAMSIAYDNWLADFCQTDPHRLKGVAILPIQDVGEAVKELRRAVIDLGFVAGVIPYHSLGRDLSHPDFYPLWETAQDLGVPVTVHAGQNLPHPGREELFTNYFMDHVIAHPFSQMAAATAVIAGGVLELFPRLRVAFLESGCGWLPYLVERLDEHYESLPRDYAPHLKKAPSEYVADGNVYISFEPDEKAVAYVASVIGKENLVFASDYPHLDAAFPHATAEVLEREEFDDATKRLLLRENAIRLYGMNGRSNGKGA